MYATEQPTQCPASLAPGISEVKLGFWGSRSDGTSMSISASVSASISVSLYVYIIAKENAWKWLADGV